MTNLPIIDIDTIEYNDAGYMACISAFSCDENGKETSTGDVFFCPVVLQMDKSGRLHSRSCPKTGRDLPSVVADIFDTVHIEYHRNGLLHSWYGPALLHGKQIEYWLFGHRLDVEDYTRLTKTLDRHRCYCDFGQWMRVPAYNACQFLGFCEAINILGQVTPGAHNASNRWQRKTQAETIRELRLKLDAVEHVCAFFASQYQLTNDHS